MADSFLAWLADNWDVIIGTVGFAHLAALGIVNLTPSEYDNKVYERFYKWIEMLAGIITTQAKQPRSDQK